MSVVLLPENTVVKKAMNSILLIMPPVNPKGDAIGKNLAYYKELPYGLLVLAAYLRAYAKKDIEIEILDLNVIEENLINNSINAAMEKFRPDVIGISGLFNTMFKWVNEISAYIKNLDKEVLLLIGGNIATNCYEQLFKYNEHVDAVCYAEGEAPLLALINSADYREELANNNSWITREKLAGNFVPVPTFIENLDEIPPVDFSMVDLGKYDSRCRNNNPKSYDEEKALRLPFVTTRGCPYNCVFCAASSLSGKKVRFMSAERVVADVKSAIDNFGMTKLVINDDQVLIDKRRIKKILDEIADFNLVLEFPSGLNAKFIDEDVAVRLKRAGLDVANLAVESGSPRVLKEIIDKPMKMADVYAAVAALRKHGLLVHGFFIFGFPGETEEDRVATVDLIKNVGFDWSNIYVAAPLRGSRLYELCVEQGYIEEDKDIIDANIYASSIRSENIDPDYITKYVYRVNLDVNFVNNYRMKIKDFESAQGYFRNVVNNHPGHAFAHYYLACAYAYSGKHSKCARKHYNQFKEIVETDSFWAEHAQYFNVGHDAEFFQNS